ncbi:MAG: glycosyltransferase, partial [Myxococcales bacterium]|nr:glycosyltransferase [Myxococcales bacterium]
MIVKNEEAALGEAIRSAAHLVDEIVIVDTGSTDGTIELARGLGARVFEHPWNDSLL